MEYRRTSTIYLYLRTKKRHDPDLPDRADVEIRIELEQAFISEAEV